MKQDTKKVFIKNFGCQMNVRDSEIICGLLIKEGYQLVDDPKKADAIIFNTCSVRQHAEEKVWSELGRINKMSSPDFVRKTRKIKAGRTPRPDTRRKIIGLVGCMAQNYQDDIFQKAENVDFAVGPSDIQKIPEIIKKLSANRYSLYATKIWETDSTIRPDEIYHAGFYEDEEHAYVVISEGCSNFCSYCVVPFVRGELHNRNHKEILKEIGGAVNKGITKITLLGQNVNAYKSGVRGQGSGVNFEELLKMVNGVKGLKEFSFITSHPKDTSLDLFRVMAASDKLKKYLHLPVQSGSDRILKLMNRGYNRRFYLDLADNYRKIVKGACLTTDIIVGFPGETEEDFLDTYNLVEEAQFDAAYIFKYSPRPHTEAQRLADEVDIKDKEARHRVILELQKKISKAKKE